MVSCHFTFLDESYFFEHGVDRSIYLTNTKLLDHVNTSTLLEQTNTLSVNQMNCQIKIQEVWKALNVTDYPIEVTKQTANESGPTTRATTVVRLIENGLSCLSQKTCINDAVRIWNKLPTTVTECATFGQIKKQAKTFAKTLPV